MKRLLSRIALFAFGLNALAFIIEGVIYMKMQGRRAHVHEDWPDMHGLAADIVFLGNSRTAGHVIPSIVGKDIDAEVYNLAYDGYTSQMGYYRLDYLLRHASKQPDIVVLQTDLSFCVGGSPSNFPMKDGVLRYFFLDQIGINNYYRNYVNWRELDAYIPLLRYKGYPLIFFKHLLGWNRWDRRSENGFWHTDKAVGFVLDEAPKNKDTPLQLAGIDSLCNSHGIQLIGIIPPSPKSSYRPSNAKIWELQEDFPVWDFSNFFEAVESEYFYDGAHFSFKGAQEYSRAIHDKFKMTEISNLD